MNTRVVVFASVAVALILGGIGFTAAALGSDGRRFGPRRGENERRETSNGNLAPRRNSAPLWWFAAGGALLIGLAGVPLLRRRRRGASSS
jgi:hypothetical protein